ncbi:unnamed protein product, partial [Prorocentrum cordatum]
MTATQCQLPNHKCVQMGWRKSRTTNNSCGLAVLYGKRVQGALQQVAVPPTKLGITGRVGMVRFAMQGMSIAIFPIYVPPKGMAANTLRQALCMGIDARRYTNEHDRKYVPVNFSRDFIDIYSPSVSEWNSYLGEADYSYSLLRGQCPISKATVDIGIGLFVDDVSRVHVHAYAPNAKYITQQLNHATHTLQQHINTNGHHLNMDKTNHMIALAGQVWHEHLPYKLHRMFFLCFVYSAAITGLTAFVLPKEFTDEIDSTLAKLLRCLMKGSAATEYDNGRIRTISNSEVFDHWKLSRTATELRIQRIRWWQQISKEPDNHRQVLTAMFGTTELDMQLGRRRLDQVGTLTKYSTPWAVQCLEDLKFVAQFARDFDEAWTDKENVLLPFQDSTLSKIFAKINIGSLRPLTSTKNITRWNKVLQNLGLREISEEDAIKMGILEVQSNISSNSSIAEEFICTHENEDGTICASTFNSMKDTELHSHLDHVQQHAPGPDKNQHQPSDEPQGDEHDVAIVRSEKRRKTTIGDDGGKGKTGNGKSNGSASEVNKDDEMVTIEKLCLNNAQIVRQLSGSLWDFYLVEGEHTPSEAGANEGQEYANKVQNGAKNLGSPHVYIGATFFEELASLTTTPSPYKETLEQFAMLINVIHVDFFGDILPYFKVKKAYSEAGMGTRWKIHILFNALAMSPWTEENETKINQKREAQGQMPIKLEHAQTYHLRQATHVAITNSGGNAIVGAPPPSALTLLDAGRADRRIAALGLDPEVAFSGSPMARAATQDSSLDVAVGAVKASIRLAAWWEPPGARKSGEAEMALEAEAHGAARVPASLREDSGSGRGAAVKPRKLERFWHQGKGAKREVCHAELGAAAEAPSGSLPVPGCVSPPEPLDAGGSGRLTGPDAAEPKRDECSPGARDPSGNVGISFVEAGPAGESAEVVAQSRGRGMDTAATSDTGLKSSGLDSSKTADTNEVQWEWEHRTGWRPYDARAQVMIEKAYRDGVPKVRLKTGKGKDVPMEIFFRDCKQWDPI